MESKDLKVPCERASKVVFGTGVKRDPAFCLITLRPSIEKTYRDLVVWVVLQDGTYAFFMHGHYLSKLLWLKSTHFAFFFISFIFLEYFGTCYHKIN